VLVDFEVEYNLSIHCVQSLKKAFVWI
jgi:hypothetical protein